ncbi:MAG: CBS domain-containing protein [Anaerolineae bacterium]|nr:CBS domain-containing protein [Anaerolineae bacterium]
MKKELVKNWMTRDVVTITPDTSLPETHRLMTDYHIRRIPVVHDGTLVGIVTLGDVREAEPSDATSLSIWEMNYLLSKLKIESVMTKNPITISPYATISEAAWTMLEYKVSGLPVVNEDRKVIGIITESDIFRLVVQQWDKMETTVSKAHG